jgi:hypothetical protein
MTSKKASQSTRPTRQLIHEHNPATRLHRLVIVRDGRPDASPWMETNTIGIYKGIHFAVNVSTFPGGPFLVRALPYEVLA